MSVQDRQSLLPKLHASPLAKLTRTCVAYDPGRIPHTLADVQAINDAITWRATCAALLLIGGAIMLAIAMPIHNRRQANLKSFNQAVEEWEKFVDEWKANTFVMGFDGNNDDLPPSLTQPVRELYLDTSVRHLAMT